MHTKPHKGLGLAKLRSQPALHCRSRGDRPEAETKRVGQDLAMMVNTEQCQSMGMGKVVLTYEDDNPELPGALLSSLRDGCLWLSRLLPNLELLSPNLFLTPIRGGTAMRGLIVCSHIRRVFLYRWPSGNTYGDEREG
jgi:hypothetical protein